MQKNRPRSLVSPKFPRVPQAGLVQGWESVCWAVAGTPQAEDANHPSGRCTPPQRKMQTTEAEYANYPKRKMQTTQAEDANHPKFSKNEITFSGNIISQKTLGFILGLFEVIWYIRIHKQGFPGVPEPINHENLCFRDFHPSNLNLTGAPRDRITPPHFENIFSTYFLEIAQND